MSSAWARAALSRRICAGLPRRRLGKLITELAGPWLAQQESPLRERRGGGRRRAAGAGPGHDLVFTDRVIATLVILRFQLPHAALALCYGVDRPAITRAVHEIRPLLARRGFAVPGQSGLRLRTLADVFAYAAAEGVTLRIDGTEVQVRKARGEPARAQRVRRREEEAEHDQADRGLDTAAALGELGLDLAIVILLPPHDPAVLAPLAEALAQLR